MNRFEPFVERMRVLEFPDADEGDERVHILPPASPAALLDVERRLRGPLPRAVSELLEVTGGFVHGSAELDFGVTADAP